jgi:hypothetical protein
MKLKFTRNSHAAYTSTTSGDGLRVTFAGVEGGDHRLAEGCPRQQEVLVVV